MRFESRDKVNEEAHKSQCRAEAEDRYYEDLAQPFLDELGEVGRELEEFHREYTCTFLTQEK